MFRELLASSDQWRFSYREGRRREDAEKSVDGENRAPQDALALVADGLCVDIDMTCDAGFVGKGEIRLKGARIGQSLDFSGAQVNAEFDAETDNEAGAEKRIANALNAEDIQAN